MKKSILKFFVAGMALMCTQGVNAQVDLGNILGQVMSSGNGEEVVSSLTSVFSSKKQHGCTRSRPLCSPLTTS